MEENSGLFQMRHFPWDGKEGEKQLELHLRLQVLEAVANFYLQIESNMLVMRAKWIMIQHSRKRCTTYDNCLASSENTIYERRASISFDSCETIEPPVHESFDVPSLLCSHSEVSDCETCPEEPEAPDGPDDEDDPAPDGPPEDIVREGV